MRRVNITPQISTRPDIKPVSAKAKVSKTIVRPFKPTKPGVHMAYKGQSRKK